jgi:hypothetical protein
MPAIGGLPGVAKVSTSGRQGLRGGFAVLSLALKFAFPGNRRLGLQDSVRGFLLTPRKAKHLAVPGPFGRQVSEARIAVNSDRGSVGGASVTSVPPWPLAVVTKIAAM